MSNIAAFFIFLYSKTYAKVSAESAIRISEPLLVSWDIPKMHAKVQLIPSIRSTVMTVQNLASYIHTYICTHKHFLDLLFWLRNLKHIEINQNLWFEHFHRYKAFSLRKQQMKKKKFFSKKNFAKLLFFLNKTTFKSSIWLQNSISSKFF